MTHRMQPENGGVTDGVLRMYMVQRDDGRKPRVVQCARPMPGAPVCSLWGSYDGRQGMFVWSAEQVAQEFEDWRNEIATVCTLDGAEKERQLYALQTLEILFNGTAQYPFHSFASSLRRYMIMQFVAMTKQYFASCIARDMPSAGERDTLLSAMANLTL